VDALDQDLIADLYLIALCNWREARGESLATKVGQAWTVRNRVLQPRWWGTSWVGVITKFAQYSSFNPDDPNSRKWPLPKDPAWADCFKVAELVYSGSIPDPTFGATHYFDASLDSHPPTWATDGTMTKTAELERLRFYRMVQK
jgi:N-acetylmuramoyl-L-alanine amidase